MSEDVDGRQTRPANDVGRPDGSPECFTLAGWKGAVESIKRAEAATKAKKPELAIGWLCSAIEAIVGEPTYAAIQERAAARQRFRGGEAPHGEAPQDAEA